MKKKIISLSLATAMALGTVGGAFAVNEQGQIMESKAYVNGYEDGTFKPNRNVSREEVAKMISVLKGLAETAENFDDVDNNSWAAGFIGAAQKAGLVKGDENGKFNPTAGLTRAELATIVSRAIGDAEGTSVSFNDIEGHWAKADIMNVSKAGIIEGRGNGVFDPNGAVTRAESVKMLNGMVGILNADALEGSVANPFSDIEKHWAKNQILAAATEYSYSLDAEGNIVVAGNMVQTAVDEAIEAAEAGSEITIDLSGADSDIVVETEKELTITLEGDMGSKNLTVDTPNATVIWDGETTGDVTIEDVDNNSFIIRGGSANGIIFRDTNGGRVSNESGNPIAMTLGAGANARLEGIFGELKSEGTGANAPKLTLGAGVQAILSGIFGQITGEGTGANAPKLTLGAGVQAILSGNFGTITNNGATGVDQSGANIGQVVGPVLPPITPVAPPAGGGGGGSTALTLDQIFNAPSGTFGKVSGYIDGNTLKLKVDGTGTDNLSAVLESSDFTISSERAGNVVYKGISSPLVPASSVTGNIADGAVGVMTADQIKTFINNGVNSAINGNTSISDALVNKGISTNFEAMTLSNMVTLGSEMKDILTDLDVSSYKGISIVSNSDTSVKVKIEGGQFIYSGTTVNMTVEVDITI